MNALETTCPLAHLIEKLHMSTLTLLSSATEEIENAIVRCQTIANVQEAETKNEEGPSIVRDVQEVESICKTTQNILISAMQKLEGTTSV